jgi:predicted ATPase
LGPRRIFDRSDFSVRQHRQLGPQGEYTAHFLGVFGDEKLTNKDLHHPQAVSANLRNQIEAWLSEISPGTRLQITPYAGLDIVNLEYSFNIGRQVSKQYSSTNVGFGLTYTLPILVAILSAQPGTLLLIENPEAHLHPQGQTQIGHLMALAANYGVQVVVETHSDHVLNGIRVAVHGGLLPPEDVKLHFFSLQEYEQEPQSYILRCHVTSPRIDRDGRIDHWPDGFFNEWDKNLRTLLRPGKNK